MKKLILVFLTILVFVTVSCGSSKKDGDSDTQPDTDETSTSDSDTGDTSSDEDKTDTPDSETGDTSSDEDKTDTSDSDTGDTSSDEDKTDTSDSDTGEVNPDDPYECSPTSLFPCHDSKTGKVWSSISENDMDWERAVQYCEDLEEGGKTDWRLPTIDELRTLIRNCKITATGGSCEVSESEGMLSVADMQGCSCEFDEEFSGKYSKMGDISKTLWSSSEQSEADVDDAWRIDFNSASIEVSNKYTVYFVRCVEGEKPENGEIEIKECNQSSKKTCFDPATGLYWSKMSLGGTWDEGKNYCESFQINDLKGWRLPTIDELRTTIRNCARTVTGGSCEVSEKENKLSSEFNSLEECSCEKLTENPDGKYSEFGDTDETLLSSTFASDDPELVWTISADDASVFAITKYFSYFFTRCVKKAE